MNLLKLLSRSQRELPNPSEKQIRKAIARLARYDEEAEERIRNRVLSHEQLTRAIDYGARHP